MSFGQAKLLKQNLQRSRATRLPDGALVVNRAHASEKEKHKLHKNKRAPTCAPRLADPPQVLGPRVPPHELGPVHDEAVRHPIHDAARERERLHAAPRLDEDHP